jgi:hypothetical protein
MNRVHVKSLFLLSCLAALIQSGVAGATTVAYPYIDVIENPGDSGVVATGSLPTLNMGASAVGVVNGPGSINDFATPVPFSLSATYSASLTAADGTLGDYDYTNGLIMIGSTTSPLLTATFTDLVMESGGDSLFQFVIASSALNYTGGSLAGPLSGGNILGSFTVGASTPNALGNADLSRDFTGSNLTAKVGPVVPLPATLPLLLCGLGLVSAVARRLRPIASAAC